MSCGRERVLARTRVVQVTCCSCGRVRLQVGFAALHLDPASFEELVTAIDSARAHLLPRVEPRWTSEQGQG